MKIGSPALPRLSLFIAKCLEKKSSFINYTNRPRIKANHTRIRHCRVCFRMPGGGQAAVRRSTGAWTARGDRRTTSSKCKFGAVAIWRGSGEGGVPDRHLGYSREKSGGGPIQGRWLSRAWPAPSDHLVCDGVLRRFSMATSGTAQAMVWRRSSDGPVP